MNHDEKTNKQLVLSELMHDHKSVHDLKPLLTNNLFHSYLVGNPVDNSLSEYLVNALDIKISHTYFCMTSFKLLPGSSVLAAVSKKQHDHKGFSDEIYNHIKENSPYPVWFYKMNYHSTLIIFNFETDMNITNFISSIQEWILDNFCLKSSWGVSSICTRPEELWRLSEETVVATRASESGEINLYVDSLGRTGSVYFPKQLETLIVNSIKTNDIDTIDFVIEILKDENFIVRHADAESFAALNALLVNTLYKLHTPMDAFDEYFLELNNFVNHYNGNYAEYFNYLTQILHHISLVTDQKKTTKKNILTDNIAAYITDNFSDCDLSLSKVADIFSISEGYISSIFKENSGTSFTDYVEDLRITQACRLLTETDKSILEVSKLSGYANVYSFRRAFKRNQNASPKDYRCSHQIE